MSSTPLKYFIYFCTYLLYHFNMFLIEAIVIIILNKTSFFKDTKFRFEMRLHLGLCAFIFKNSIIKKRPILYNPDETFYLKLNTCYEIFSFEYSRFPTNLVKSTTRAE